MKAIDFFIPGAPASPNRPGRTVRARIAQAKAERERAYLCAVAARNKRGVTPFTGPARIRFEVLRARALDPSVNLPASLKHYQDGICKALLPLGDGPKAPYTWEPPLQLPCAKADEGVNVLIEEPEEGDPPAAPFSGGFGRLSTAPRSP